MTNTTVGVTGNRNLVHSTEAIETELVKIFERIQPKEVITGMAIGFDQVVAELCIKLNIPFIAAVPFVSQAILWPEETQNNYMQLLEKAKEVVVVSDGDYALWKMHKRNEWIVSHASLMVAYLQAENGGTASCVKAAQRLGVPVEFVLRFT